jgi:thioredoxin-like negative regulator of GroEL
MAGSPEEFLSDVNSNPNNHELRFKLAEAYLANLIKKQMRWNSY